MGAYVLIWFAYMILLPARVHYEFSQASIEAWRSGRLIKAILVADIEEVFPSWWEGGESGMLPGLWQWPPRFGCQMKDGEEAILPTILNREGAELISTIARVTGLHFHSSYTGKDVVRPTTWIGSLRAYLLAQ